MTGINTKDAPVDGTKTDEEALDEAVENSMDASDPPAITPPGADHEPPASSGYDAEKETRRKDR